MTKLIQTLLISGVMFFSAAVLSTNVFAGEAMQVAKTPSCKQQAKKAGLKTKKEKRAFIKDCKAKMKKAKAKSKPEE